MAPLVLRSILIGTVASLALFGLSFGVTSIVSGVNFAWRQFTPLEPGTFNLRVRDESSISQTLDKSSAPQGRVLTGFSDLWYWMVALIVGFGIEVGLFAYLRGSQKHASAGVVAGGGAGSTIAMVACCAHRLVDLLPFLGLTLFAAALTKYQVYLLAASVLFNLGGIVYLITMIKKHTNSI